MTTTAPTSTYVGVVRVLDAGLGWLLDVGKGELSVTDPDVPAWSGTLTVSSGSCLEAKSLTTIVELNDGSRGRAQVGPKLDDAGPGMIRVKVVGLAEPPF
ncbi:MAG: hypothetical protein R6X29_06435 [Acidimicrobiia bacterium]|jgi:hypothetical protein